MLVFAILLALFALFHLPGLNRLPALLTRRDKAAAALAAMFLFTGTDHLLNPTRYLVMMPPWIPAHEMLIFFTGFCELLGAVGLLLRKYRRMAALCLIAFLILVFQANLYVAVEGLRIQGMPDAAWYYWLRLPLQFLLIAWAWFCAQRESPAPFTSDSN